MCILALLFIHSFIYLSIHLFVIIYCSWSVIAILVPEKFGLKNVCILCSINIQHLQNIDVVLFADEFIFSIETEGIAYYAYRKKDTY